MNDQSRPVTHYNSSKGPVLITSMVGTHLRNAAEKIRREGDPSRRAELLAMDQHLAVLDEAEAKGEGEDPEPAPASQAIGANKPPEPIAFAAVKEKIDDLYDEAKNWLDGAKIENQAQADEVSRLKGMLAAAEKEADETRKVENKPFDDGKAEVQTRYAPLIADTKAVKGKTVVAIAACAAALTPWLLKVEQQQMEAARAARAAADKAIEDAQVAAAVADPSRLDDSEVVEELIQDAKTANREAISLESERARAGVGSGFRSTLLRDNWVAQLADGDAALAHFWKMCRGDVEAFLSELATKEIRSGKRSIPGFNVINDKKAA